MPEIRYTCDPSRLFADDATVDFAALQTARVLQLSHGLWLRCPAHQTWLRSAAQTRPVIVADAWEVATLRRESRFPELADNIDLVLLCQTHKFLAMSNVSSATMIVYGSAVFSASTRQTRL